MPTPSLSPLQESMVIGLAIGGDRHAFETLMQVYERRLFFFVRRLTGNETTAFDLLQEVWLDVFRKLSRLRSPAAFRVWLYQIAHDKAVSQVRRTRRQEELLASLPTSEEVLDASEFERSEIAAQVRACIDQLEFDHRTVITLRFLEQMDLDELSALLRVPVGTVKSRLHYAKQALRQKLSEAGYEHA